MITILISEDREKEKHLVNELLKKEGYVISDTNLDGAKIVDVLQETPYPAQRSIEDKVIEIESSLYDDKKGELYKAILEAVEKPLIEQVLKKTEGNQLKAARILGLNRNTIRTKIKKLNIDITKWKAS